MDNNQKKILDVLFNRISLNEMLVVVKYFTLGNVGDLMELSKDIVPPVEVSCVLDTLRIVEEKGDPKLILLCGERQLITINNPNDFVMAEIVEMFASAVTAEIVRRLREKGDSYFTKKYEEEICDHIKERLAGRTLSKFNVAIEKYEKEINAASHILDAIEEGATPKSSDFDTFLKRATLWKPDTLAVAILATRL